MNGNAIPLTIATRGYAIPQTAGEPDGEGAASRPGRRQRKEPATAPSLTLVFDCETTLDASQRLTFGAYRVYGPAELIHGPYSPMNRERGYVNERGEVLIEEGLFYADDLPERDPEGFAILQAYTRDTLSDAPTDYNVSAKPLRLLSRREFVNDVLYPLAVKARALVIGFNLPFDISRIAVDVGEGRGQNSGAFSFTLWQYADKQTGTLLPDSFKPRIAIRHIDSKRSVTGFVWNEQNGKHRRNRDSHPGHFLDCRTLAFALTNRGHSLRSACQAFGVEHGKDDHTPTGRITPEEIGYCRHDVRATWELFEKLREEYERHPIDLPARRALSPAAIGKAYLRAMGVSLPQLVSEIPGWSPEAIHGACMMAYYGGLPECRIRRTAVPVGYTDCTSMYATVNTLMGLWWMLTAERVHVVDATAEVRAFLESVTETELFDPATWKRLPALVQVIPDGDVLPVRAPYSGQDWQLGRNRLTSPEPLWCSLGECIAAKVLGGGKVPKVLRAVRFIPEGQQDGLRPVKLRGSLSIDPRSGDFFRAVIEMRKSLPAELPAEERNRLDAFLKVLANATSYGIFVEMRQTDEPADVQVWDGDAESFTCHVDRPETLGAYCFPPLAALITGAARLMLALLEHQVSTLGGSYAFGDTDSMAIVATPDGGLVPCEGGAERMADGRQAIRALSWAQVDGIRQRFAALSPYDPTAIPRIDLLKIEDVNFAPRGLPEHKPDCICTRTRRQLHALSISAKRYALFTLDDNGTPTIVDATGHGLGHLLDPDETLSTEAREEAAHARPWEMREWLAIVQEAIGREHKAASDPPQWREHPAVTRLTVSTPEVWRAFDILNAVPPSPAVVRAHRRALDAAREKVEAVDVQCAALEAALATDSHASFTRWLARTDTRYDAEYWRSSGRLRAIPKPVVGVADWLRATVDYTVILDRPAQELGESVDDLLSRVEQAARTRQELARVKVARRHLLAELRKLQRPPSSGERRPYAEQAKPFNFVLACHIAPLGFPVGVEPGRFRLIAPFERDPKRRTRLDWRNLYDPSGTAYRIRTGVPEQMAPNTVIVQSYGDVVRAYRIHPEAKSGDAEGRRAGRQTAGLLSRLDVNAVARRTIGKESNRLEEVEEGLIGEEDAVYTTYRRPDERIDVLRRALDHLPMADVAKGAGVSAFRLREIVAGREAPHARTLGKLERTVHRLLCERLRMLEGPSGLALPLDALVTVYAERLAAVRAELTGELCHRAEGMSERKLAALLGTSQATLHRWMTSGPPVEPAKLTDLHRRLGDRLGNGTTV